MESNDEPVFDKRVLISIPTKGEIRAETVGWLLKFVKHAHKKGIAAGTQIVVSPYPLDHMRNKQVKGFLETDYTHMFLLDADCEPPEDCVEKLLEHDLDIVAAVAPGVVEGNIVFTAAVIDEEADGPFKYKMHSPRSPHLPKGLQEIDACGATGVLIKREVLEKMSYPWFKTLVSPDGETIRSGEDFFFCAKAKEVGFKVYADFDIVQRHYKVVSLV